MLEYCMEIIRNAIQQKNLKNKSYEIPKVYPIVLYIGKRKWNVTQNIQDVQKRIPRVTFGTLGTYEILDINDYTEEELWKEDTLLSKVLLLEKSNDKEKSSEMLKKIFRTRISEEESRLLIQIIKYGLNNKIDLNNIIKIEENLKGGGERKMSALVEYIRDWYDEGMEKARKEGLKNGRAEGRAEERKASIRKIARRMLKNNTDDNTIISITEISKKELKKLKEEMNL